MNDQIKALNAENKRLNCSCEELLEQNKRLIDEKKNLEIMLKEEQEKNVELRMDVNKLEGAVEAYRYCIGRCTI